MTASDHTFASYRIPLDTGGIHKWVEDRRKAQSLQRRQRKAFRSHRTRVVHFHAVEYNVRGIAIQRLIRGLLQLAASQSLHNALRSCRQFRGGLVRISFPANFASMISTSSAHLGLGDGKTCSEVEERLLLHLVANSAALDQANGPIGFVGGAAGQCLANIHAPTLEASRRFGNP